MDLAELHVVVEGPSDAPPLVLVHGAPDRSAAFRRACDHLAARVRVVRYDRRGYGRSIGATAAETMGDHARDLLAVIDAVGGRATVVAHSFGSNPAMLAAVTRPSAFAALGVWEPPMVWLDWWPRTTKDFDAKAAAAPDPERVAEEFNRRILGDDAWNALGPEKRALRRAEGAAFARDMASLATAPFGADDLTVAMLVGHGSDTSPEHVEGARRLVGDAADARLIRIEGAGHFANQTHPEAFAAFMTATLELGETAGRRPGPTHPEDRRTTDQAE